MLEVEALPKCSIIAAHRVPRRRTNPALPCSPRRAASPFSTPAKLRKHCLRADANHASPLAQASRLRSFAAPKILTVDDAKAVRRLVESALREFDCDVSEADNGFKALFAMERSLPVLILLDVNMPTLGGVEILTLLRSKPELKAIPVIMLTSPADHAVADQIAALGVSGTLMKPFTPDALIEKIRGVLDLKLRRSS